MKVLACQLPRQAPAGWLRVVGLFAVALQTWGGVALRTNTAAGVFYAEICSSAGLGKADPARQSGDTSPGDGGRECGPN